MVYAPSGWYSGEGLPILEEEFRDTPSVKLIHGGGTPAVDLFNSNRTILISGRSEPGSTWAGDKYNRGNTWLR